MKRAPWLFVLLSCAFVTSAHAAGFDGGSGFRPQVPVSAFARPAQWLDMSKLSMSAEFIMGSGGQGMDGLQVTRFQYQVGAPLAVRVSVGNAFGGGAGSRNGMFLEGLDVSYQPFRSMLIQVRYQDVRTHLQYGRTGPFTYPRTGPFDTWH